MRGYVTLFIFDNSELDGESPAGALGSVMQSVLNFSGTSHLCFGDLEVAAGGRSNVPEFLGFLAEGGAVLPAADDSRLSNLAGLQGLSGHGVGILSEYKDAIAAIHQNSDIRGFG